MLIGISESRVSVYQICLWIKQIKPNELMSQASCESYSVSLRQELLWDFFNCPQKRKAFEENAIC